MAKVINTMLLILSVAGWIGAVAVAIAWSI
jgi:hypothetical protein